jgi:hypothetical protein
MLTAEVITAEERAVLSRADQIDAERVRAWGRWINCHGAADLRDEANGLRAQVRSAVYHRAGEATGLPIYKDAYQVAGLRAVKAAGFPD